MKSPYCKTGYDRAGLPPTADRAENKYQQKRARAKHSYAVAPVQAKPKKAQPKRLAQQHTKEPKGPSGLSEAEYGQALAELERQRPLYTAPEAYRRYLGNQGYQGYQGRQGYQGHMGNKGQQGYRQPDGMPPLLGGMNAAAMTFAVQRGARQGPIFDGKRFFLAVLIGSTIPYDMFLSSTILFHAIKNKNYGYRNFIITCYRMFYWLFHPFIF